MNPSKLLRAFRLAFAGLWYLLRTQQNARIEIFLGVIACALGWWLKIGSIQWAILAIAIAMVLIVEGLNTAIEASVDLASPQVHPLAKKAKDVAAATVLIAAIASAIVGLLILGPPLWEKIKR